MILNNILHKCKLILNKVKFAIYYDLLVRNFTHVYLLALQACLLTLLANYTDAAANINYKI